MGIFDGAVNGWRNASLDSAKLSVEIEITDRTNWLFPAIMPRVSKLFNDWVVKPTSAAVGLFTRPEPKEPPPMPELPEAFRGNALGQGLEATYRQRCNSIIAGTESTKCMLNLNFTGMRQQEAIQAHQAALDRVSLPENYAATAGVATSGGTVVGNLVANVPRGTGGTIGDAVRAFIS